MTEPTKGWWAQHWWKVATIVPAVVAGLLFVLKLLGIFGGRDKNLDAAAKSAGKSEAYEKMGDTLDAEADAKEADAKERIVRVAKESKALREKDAEAKAHDEAARKEIGEKKDDDVDGMADFLRRG